MSFKNNQFHSLTLSLSGSTTIAAAITSLFYPLGKDITLLSKISLTHRKKKKMRLSIDLREALLEKLRRIQAT